MKQTIIILLFALLLIQPVLATQDFFITAYEETIDICLCETKLDTITITNNAQFHTTYTITTNLNDEARTAFLPPDSRQDVQIPITAFCNDKAEVKNYFVYVENEFGGTQKLTRSLNQSRCESIQSTLTAPRTADPCQILEYELLINNTAPFTEQYFIRPITYTNYFSNDLYSVTLEPGQAGLIETELTLACELYGEKEIAFEIESVNNNLKQQVTQNLTVNRKYDFDLNVETEEYYCAQEVTKIPVTITNMAAFENDYSLSLQNAPRGVSLQQDTLTIQSQQQNNTYITVYGTGEFEFNVSVTSEKGDLQATKKVNVQRDYCYNYDIEIPFNKVCENTEKNILITNEGIQENELELIVNGATQEEEIRVLAYETKQVPLLFEDPTIKNLEITLLINNKNITSSRTIEVIESIECGRPTISQNINTRYFQESFSLTLSNVGIQNEQYNITIPELNYQETIELDSSNSKKLEVPQNYTKQDIGIKEYNIIINSNLHSYNFDLTVDVLDNYLLVRADEYVRENNCEVFNYILIILLIIALISVIHKFNNKKYEQGMNKKKIFFTILIPIIIILTLFIYEIPMYERTGVYEENGIRIKFYSDENKTIDLNEFFVDPDSGDLTYDMGWDPGINYTIQNNILTLIPDNWTGKSILTIIATDDFNESTESPELNLEVIQRPDYGYQSFCPFINALLLIILLVILIFTPIKK